jgi:hypothetical protein
LISVKVAANKTCYKICLRNIFLAPNTSTFLQAALAAEAHLADGQFVHAGENLNCAVTKIPYRNPETYSFQDRRTERETKLDVDQKQSV